ncbi:hypothetical protein [Aeromonas hydrophila]|jgi:hypothetical protein|uniref:hypothetical protein n=1 Tax=Aeromonas hydrophila TaxID=644 RepID=UPI00225652C8|nr:hypothetical protein [Aeromonas hydrophila]MCX4117324.1 hypothetical protein [Aeromonas hydrophila]
MEMKYHTQDEWDSMAMDLQAAILIRATSMSNEDLKAWLGSDFLGARIAALPDKVLSSVGAMLSQKANKHVAEIQLLKEGQHRDGE